MVANDICLRKKQDNNKDGIFVQEITKKLNYLKYLKQNNILIRICWLIIWHNLKRNKYDRSKKMKKKRLQY